MSAQRELRLALVFVACACLAGCGGGKQPVRGTVTLDGEPVADGGIVFTAVEAGKPGGSANIIDGKYELPPDQGLAAGAHKVAITWKKKTGRSATAENLPEKVPERREVIPARYNDKTELTADVKPSGENVFDFALTGGLKK